MKEKTSILKELRIALLDKLKESLVSVFPVTLLVFLLAMTPWVDITPRELTVFGLSALFLILGISLFNLGADMAMTPMGQYVGEGLTKSKKLGILLSVSFVMGLFITAHPVYIMITVISCDLRCPYTGIASDEGYGLISRAAITGNH